MNTIVLEGGLGNRMRVAAAAYTTAQRINIPFRVLWPRQWGMHCRFDELFLPFETDLLSLRDRRGMERYLFTRAKPSNLYLPRLAQRLCYRHIILSPQIYYLQRDGYDFDTWFRQDDCLMTAYRDFCTWSPTVLSQLFRPLPSILRAVATRSSTFSPHTIGLHIRRTDNQQSIDESPNELFFDVINRELSLHPDLHVYLATDDQPTKHLFCDRYGSDRIQVAPGEATRDNTEGIREALIELLLLSRTSHIYGSAGSTYSEIASKYTSTPLTILRQ